jgi:hypothetical protein
MELDSVPKYHHSNRLNLAAQLAEHMLPCNAWRNLWKISWNSPWTKSLQLEEKLVSRYFVLSNMDDHATIKQIKDSLGNVFYTG